jgi:hypothetical protein
VDQAKHIQFVWRSGALESVESSLAAAPSLQALPTLTLTHARMANPKALRMQKPTQNWMQRALAL